MSRTKIISQWHIPLCRKHRRSCCRRSLHHTRKITWHGSAMRCRSTIVREPLVVCMENCFVHRKNTLSPSLVSSLSNLQKRSGGTCFTGDWLSTVVVVSSHQMEVWEAPDVSLKSWFHRGFYRQNARVYRRNAECKWKASWRKPQAHHPNYMTKRTSRPRASGPGWPARHPIRT